MSFITHKTKVELKSKKKPPPRPPPPNFSKYKKWSPPNSPTPDRTHSTFGGSVSSSFSSSTSSLASSKKSFESDIAVANNGWPINTNTNLQNYIKPYTHQGLQYGKPNIAIKPTNIPKPSDTNISKVNVPTIFGPTIIRAQVPKAKFSERKEKSDPPSPVLPMPSIPPPSPPKEVTDIEVPYGIALYDFQATDPRDLSFQVNDVVILLRRISNEWLYGKVIDKEGMFPANFIEIQVPLPEDKNVVTALYEFNPQMEGDLQLKPGQSVRVLRKINDDWLYGESNGERGQFPSNFIDRIPNL